MKKALIFIGGSAPDYTEYSHELTDCDACIAADSGYDLALRDHIDIDLLIGDMDSIRSRIPEGILTETYPQDKDYTDTELAIRYVQSLEENHEIVLIGGGEGRLDHTMALLSLYTRSRPPLRWYTALECLHYVTEADSFATGEMKTVSIMGLTEKPVLVTTHGLHWELAGFPISLGNHSISNRSKTQEFTVEIQGDRGVLIGIAYR